MKDEISVSPQVGAEELGDEKDKEGTIMLSEVTGCFNGVSLVETTYNL